MQKKSRFLTGLLSAVMALTLFALPATAAQTENANTIDTGKTGSITIHKYEYNGTGGQAGTGEASDENNVPTDKVGDVEGAKPLDGVTFEIYKVLDADNLVKYYNNPTGFTEIFDTNGKALSTSLTEKDAWAKYAEARTDGKIGYKWKEGAVPTDTTTLFHSDVTRNGKVPVGLYLVIEKDAPSQVTGASDPFFVSIPMTRQNANGNTEWLYTVEAFPKNKTTYGDISLVKYGYVGGPTEDNAPEILKGVTFKLYQFTGKNGVTPFTGTPSNDWKEITGKTANGSTVNTVTNEKGEITVSGLAAGDYCFVEDAVGDNQAYIIDQRPYYFRMNNDSTSRAFTFKADGSVNLLGAQASQNLKIQANDYRPDVEKQVKKGDGYDARADYSIGDYIPYRVTVTVPENIANLKTFVVTDTPKNLEFVQGDTTHPFAVTCGNATISPDAYAVTKNVNNGFDLTFTATSLANYKGQKIVIDYYAKLLDTAKSDTTGNHNMVSLKYTNKIDANGTPVDGEKEIQDNVVVYSFGIKVKKTDESGNLLDGVEFDLYRVDENGQYKLSDFGWKDSTVKLTKVNTASLVTNKGMIEVNGLADGTYYLVETKTLKDYNLLSKAVEVNLNITYTAKWEQQGKYEDGKLVHHSMTNFKETFADGDQDGDPTFLTTTVINRKGFTLPRTGGFGTLLFSGIGALLVVGGIGVLMGTKKKKDNA